MQDQNESGRSMIEMLAVLSIMGVIMYGAVAGINFGIDMYKINATYNEVEELAQSVVDLYSWTRSYEGLSDNAAKTICDNDAYPTCSSNNTVMTNQWGGGVDVSPVQGGEYFKIEYGTVPAVACERLRTEPGFQNVCVGAETNCDGAANNLIFYSKGANACR